MPRDRKKYNKEYNKQWYQNNKEYKKEQSKEYYQNNKEHKKEYFKEYFNIIYDIYISTDLCDYCNTPLVEGNHGSNKKCLDHNHSTGEIRGVICHTCNVRDVLS